VLRCARLELHERHLKTVGARSSSPEPWSASRVGRMEDEWFDCHNRYERSHANPLAIEQGDPRTSEPLLFLVSKNFVSRLVHEAPAKSSRPRRW